ncbi:MAG: 50S ribosomal protein L32e [Crenarchaeota archaeon]|nr:50S ribosomal protein L32e [Thermoproteota archaeon]
MSSLEEVLKRRKEVLRELRKRRALGRARKELREDRPEFLRWLWWKFPKFENDLKWKRPRGKDNKMRLKLKGYPPLAGVGYRMPKAMRELHPSGLEPVVVASVKDLEALDPKKHAVYIASTVGLRKKMELVKEASSRGFKVLNP